MRMGRGNWSTVWVAKILPGSVLPGHRGFGNVMADGGYALLKSLGHGQDLSCVLHQRRANSMAEPFAIKPHEKRLPELDRPRFLRRRDNSNIQLCGSGSLDWRDPELLAELSPSQYSVSKMPN